MDEESDIEEAVEKRFNFAAELAILVDYKVITHYVSLIDQNNNLSKNSELLQMAASFFRRIVF